MAAQARLARGHKQNLFDTHTHGLVLRLGSRTKTWYFSYRNGGPSRWLRLGTYPALSLADARKRVNVERAKLDMQQAPTQPAVVGLTAETINSLAQATAAAVVALLHTERA